MTDLDGSEDCRRMREFAAVDLSRSFVLSWEIEADSLLIDVDLFLTPEHPFYEQPRPAEKVCIRPAVIEFPVCEFLQTDATDCAANVADVAATIELGAIDKFRRLADGRYQICGAFGVVTIDAERPILRLKAHTVS